jgi:hypothetical protein
VFFPFFAEVALHRNWNPEAAGLPMNNTKICGLLSDLQASAASSRAATILSTYAGPWQRFKLWCQAKGVSDLPAPLLIAELYIPYALASVGQITQPDFVLLRCNLLATFDCWY